MTHDPVASGKTIWKGRAFNAPALIVLALVFAGSYFMFLREFAYQNADLYIHAMIAHDFDFTDLHSITSRLSYPYGTSWSARSTNWACRWAMLLRACARCARRSPSC